MGYHPRFAIWAIGGESDARTIELARRALFHLCIALAQINYDYLRAFPGTPGIYQSRVRYHDDSHLDCWRGTCRVQEDEWQDVRTTLDKKYGDCFPQGTLLLRDDFSLVPIEEIRVGDRIWGRDAWTTVEAVVYKGTLVTDGIVLNNGSVVQLTGDHHAFVGRCDQHPSSSSNHGYGCSCPLESRRVERVRVSELVEKDVMVTPVRLPFGSLEPDPDRTYVEGLYVADGWSENSRFSISGQDGCPKEAQKRTVEEICQRLGIHTRWNRKYIAVNDGDWALRMQRMGSHAPEKHVLSLNLGEAAAAATLRGVMADSKVNPNGGWTFTTTSKLLATQVRVLHKMFGRTASSMFIENHGGLGKHPIWRLGVRDPKEKSDKLLRVKRVERAIAEVPCWDIQTSDHYVYLPEHDITVSNCEDLACILVAEYWMKGINALPFPVLQSGDKGDESQLWHIQVLLPDGRIEDPSVELGMTTGIEEVA